jgi:hypothetical protein
MGATENRCVTANNAQPRKIQMLGATLEPVYQVLELLAPFNVCRQRNYLRFFLRVTPLSIVHLEIALTKRFPYWRALTTIPHFYDGAGTQPESGLRNSNIRNA